MGIARHPGGQRRAHGTALAGPVKFTYRLQDELCILSGRFTIQGTAKGALCTTCTSRSIRPMARRPRGPSWVAPGLSPRAVRSVVARRSASSARPASIVSTTSTWALSSSIPWRRGCHGRRCSTPLWLYATAVRPRPAPARRPAHHPCEVGSRRHHRPYGAAAALGGQPTIVHVAVMPPPLRGPRRLAIGRLLLRRRRHPQAHPCPVVSATTLASSSVTVRCTSTSRTSWAAARQSRATTVRRARPDALSRIDSPTRTSRATGRASSGSGVVERTSRMTPHLGLRVAAGRLPRRRRPRDSPLARELALGLLQGASRLFLATATARSSLLGGRCEGIRIGQSFDSVVILYTRARSSADT
ncbi:hypothetical protein BD626DRAFT_628023 [Schizophyllum amplum]|uniref:Uncharacterized protein n=1 Tax=Schizophyllum amplum TaxID=97359 RepID=A0A550CMM2_9AGAR|nr:hypothetical protein BD626DRAFT_628023 [Auriculariopsis ampla]